MPPRPTSGDNLAAARPSVEQNESGINLLVHANLFDYRELEIAKALARNPVSNLEIDLPKHYAPNHLVPEGEMRVLRVKARKSYQRKLS